MLVSWSRDWLYFSDMLLETFSCIHVQSNFSALE